jgi:hypothetical protein
MGTYDADPQEMARRTAILEEVSKGVKALYDAHMAAVGAIGNVWGDDETGKAFAERYVPTQQDFVDYVHNLVLGVRSSVDAIVHTALRIHVTEQENIEHGRTRA